MVNNKYKIGIANVLSILTLMIFPIIILLMEDVDKMSFWILGLVIYELIIIFIAKYHIGLRQNG
jgi:ABC-type uncharacterized transport system permease subunit